MRDLIKLEKILIVAALRDQPERPGRFSPGWFIKHANYKIYSDEDVLNTLKLMWNDKIIDSDGIDYFFQRPQYLELSRRYYLPIKKYLFGKILKTL